MCVYNIYNVSMMDTPLLELGIQLHETNVHNLISLISFIILCIISRTFFWVGTRGEGEERGILGRRREREGY